MKAKLAVAWLLSLGKRLFATPAYSLPQYPAHWALPSQTSDGTATCERRSNLRGGSVAKCVERASKPRTTNLGRISKTTKELLERRRTLRLDINASHIERQKKILEAAQRRSSLKNCRRDLREYNIPLAALPSADGTRTSSHREVEIITERSYSNLFRSSTPVSSPIIPAGEAPPRILPSEVRVATKSMKPGTALGPDFISADFLRAGGHPLHVILAAHMTFFSDFREKGSQTSGRPREPFLSTRKVTERTFGITVRYAC
ncbi:hypothetical protein RB195_018190 [Necator americanus]|uniref:Uncharacterized protein n=1 Tax=Necator americanus TaxID=51031 RepID=A0ABR1CAM8_NECAM